MKIRTNYKEYEVYSSLRLPVNVPIIIRCDGRNFHKLSENLKLQKPYDESFAKYLANAAKEVYKEGFNPVLIYLFSDEINYVFMAELPFNRRLEKILSVIPSIVSSKLTSILTTTKNFYGTISFDARAIPMPKEEIIGYLQWRQSEAWRNCVNSYAYYALLLKGYSSQKATKKLEGLKIHERHELVYDILGVNLNDIPEWQRRGFLIYKKPEKRICQNRITKQRIEVLRYKVFVDFKIPLFTTEEGERFLKNLLFQKG